MKKFFGSDKKSKQQPQAENPYAQEPADDPYANNAMSPPMQSRPGGLPSGPRAGRGGVGLPGGPSPRANSNASLGGPPPPYQQQQQQQPMPQQQSSGYGSDRYGAQAGYGANRYGDNSYPTEKGPAPAGGPRPGGGMRGPGGYGGMGRGDSANDSESGRDALFGGGRERFAANQGAQQNPRPSGGYGGGGAAPGQQQPGGYGATSPPQPNKYGGYGEERELTEEEKIKMEERDLARQIDDERNATVDTGYRILGVLNSTIETAGGTMQNLAQQDERLRNTERNLDLANIHNRTAEERTKELKYYNRSLWNPGNPFMSKTRAAEREAKMLSDHQQDRVRAEATQRDAYDSQRKYDEDMKGIQQDMAGRKALGLSSQEMAANNNKFVFDESDEEDGNEENRALRADRRAKEAEINNVIMPQMMAGVRTLNTMAKSFQPRIQESNQLIERIGTKSDAVDDGVRMNRAKLDAIYKRG